MQDGSFRIRRVDIPLDVDRACPGEGLNAWNAPHGSHNHSSVISLLALGEGEGSDTIARGRETPGRHDEERTSLDGGCQACLARAGSASCSTLGRAFCGRPTVSAGRGLQALIEAYGTTAAELFLLVEILPNIEPILRTASAA